MLVYMFWFVCFFLSFIRFFLHSSFFAFAFHSAVGYWCCSDLFIYFPFIFCVFGCFWARGWCLTSFRSSLIVTKLLFFHFRYFFFFFFRKLVLSMCVCVCMCPCRTNAFSHNWKTACLTIHNLWAWMKNFMRMKATKTYQRWKC